MWERVKKLLNICLRLQGRINLVSFLLMKWIQWQETGVMVKTNPVGESRPNFWYKWKESGFKSKEIDFWS